MRTSRCGSAGWWAVAAVAVAALLQAGVAVAQSGGRQQTEIEYDERGRVREVRVVTSAQAPQVDGLAPARVSRTTSVRMLAQGRGLRGVAIATDDPALTVSSATATEGKGSGGGRGKGSRLLIAIQTPCCEEAELNGNK
jgi:hypothetical protein